MIRSLVGTVSMSNPPTLRTLLLLAWPVILSRATQSVVGFTDALMVAPLGESALAAATTGAFDTFVLILFPMGTVFILQSFAAQLRGRGDLEAVRRYARYGLAIAAISGVVAIGVIPVVPHVVGTLGYEPAVAREMSTYVSIRLAGVGAAIGIEAIGNWFGGLGNTRVAMFAGVVTMVTNIFGNWLLIEPRLGLPGYGVAGAALASTVATYFGFGVALAAYRRSRDGASDEGPFVRRDEFVRVLRFGAPNGMNWLMEFAAFAIFVNVIVGGLGTTALAAMNVVLQVNSVAFMPAFGLASAGAILVGESIGGGELDVVPRIVRITTITASVWMIAMGLVYLVAPDLILGWFATSESDPVRVVGASMLAMSIGWQLFDAIGITLGESLRAAGDTTFCMIARVLLAWAVFVPLSLYVVRDLGMGTRGAMLSITGYLAALAVVLSLRFLSGRWRSIELVPEALV